MEGVNRVVGVQSGRTSTEVRSLCLCQPRDRQNQELNPTSRLSLRVSFISRTKSGSHADLGGDKGLLLSLLRSLCSFLTGGWVFNSSSLDIGPKGFLATGKSSIDMLIDSFAG